MGNIDYLTRAKTRDYYGQLAREIRAAIYAASRDRDYSRVSALKAKLITTVERMAQ